MEKPTPLQDFIEQQVASGGFYNKWQQYLSFHVPKHLQDTLKGLRIYLWNLEYKSGNLVPEHTRKDRRYNYVVFDENFGMMLETPISESTPCPLLNSNNKIFSEI